MLGHKRDRGNEGDEGSKRPRWGDKGKEAVVLDDDDDRGRGRGQKEEEGLDGPSMSLDSDRDDGEVEDRVSTDLLGNEFRSSTIQYDNHVGFASPGYTMCLPAGGERTHAATLSTDQWWPILESLGRMKDLKSLSRTCSYLYHVVMGYLKVRSHSLFRQTIGGYTPNAEQRAVIDAAGQGCSIYLGGEAGTGKSATLSMIRMMLESRGRHIAVTASTGAAAILINGETLHRTLKIYDGTKTAQKYFEDGRDRGSGWGAVASLDAIVVDEVSMIGATLMDKVDELLRIVKGSQAPFGGVQMILVGDFMQLAPIGTETNGEGRRVVPEPFAFKSRAWERLFGNPFPRDAAATHGTSPHPPTGRMFYLRHNFRQGCIDQGFRNLLNNLRNGSLSEEGEELLDSRVCTVEEIDALRRRGTINPIKLMPTNREVNEENRIMFQSLRGRVVTYNAVCEGNMREFPKADIPQEALPLRVGTEFVVVKNHVDPTGHRHYNGKKGRVVGFAINPKATARDGKPEDRGFKELPVAEFHDENRGREGTDRIRRLLHPLEFTQLKTDPRTGMERVVAFKYQLPVVHGWAITIHKSQGMTLKEVETDLTGVFAEGQAYVAISRLSSIGGLYLRGYERSRIMASREAFRFYFQNFPLRRPQSAPRRGANNPSSSSSSSH